MNETMKRFHTIAILCVLALASCGQKPDVPEPEPEDTTETRTLTFVLPGDAGDGFKTSWAAGDQIVVHGEYAKDQVVVTLAAGDISSDGKSATKTVDGLKPYKRDDCASVLYASYPADLSDNLKHCFFYSKFSTTNAPIMAACNSGDSFQFQNICGLLTFSLDGNFEGYNLSTPKKEALGYEFLQVKLTDSEQNYRQYVGDPVIQLEGKIGGNQVQIYVPEGTTFKAGFNLKLKVNGKFVQILRFHEPLQLERGKVVDLGDITDELEHYDDPFSDDILDLDTIGNANCYIVTQAGGYKFKAVMGNKPTQYLADVADAVVLWESWNDNSEVTPGSVLTSASYAEDYIILHTPDALKPGNAVIAARAEDGKVLWSWHIWIPETAIQTSGYGGIMGTELMDRNLGALVATAATDSQIDVRSYGLMYQWGRKDPYTAAGSFNSSGPATYAGEPEEVAPGQISLDESIANPRLLGHINNGDWLSIADNSLWSETEKTLYDPCPPGYRIPYLSGSFWSGDLTVETGWGINSTAGWLTLGSPAAVFPIAGYRDDYGVGEMAKVGTRTLYWFARAASDSAGAGADLRYDKGTFKFGSAPKARLGSVRCVAE